MSKKRDWALLDDSWMHNKTVNRVTRKYGPVAGAYWTMLIALAKHHSHHIDNPMGGIDCNLQLLADKLHDRHDRRELFQDLVDAKLIRIVGGNWREDVFADIEIFVCDFNSWQTAKGSSAYRKQKERISKVVDLQDNVTGSHNLSASVTYTDTNTDTNTYLKDLTSEKNSDSLKKPVSKKYKPDPLEIQAEIESVQHQLGDNLTSSTKSLCDVFAGKNKTGTVAESRLLTAVWRPLLKAHTVELLPVAALCYGIEQAVKANADNINYVLKAARSFVPSSTPTPQVKLGHFADNDFSRFNRFVNSSSEVNA